MGFRVSGLGLRVDGFVGLRMAQDFLKLPVRALGWRACFGWALTALRMQTFALWPSFPLLLHRRQVRVVLGCGLQLLLLSR